MIRVLLTAVTAYGFDVTDWEDKNSESGLYDNLLTEDLIERVSEGDILMYFPDSESAIEWCDEIGYKYELVEPEDDNN